MSVRTNEYTQNIAEIVTYTVDFTGDIAAGGTVTAGTATHIPPSGSPIALTCTVTSPYVYVTVPALGVTGIHNIDVLATISDGDKPHVQIVIDAVYPIPTARAGMIALTRKLRGYTSTGPADYSIAGEPYWSDAQLQDVLDTHRVDFYEHQLTPISAVESGLVVYKTFRAPYRNLESGTPFVLVDGLGTAAGTADYTADYMNGIISFTANQGGTAWYLTGRAYDLNSSAADIWRMKAAHASADFDFSTDNHSIKGSQVSIQCLKMADYYEQQALKASIKTSGSDSVLMERSDVCL